MWPMLGQPLLITAISKGLDAKIVAACTDKWFKSCPQAGINYESPKDLKGLKIATYPPGSIQDTLLRKWLKENGLDPDKDVTISANGTAGDAVSAIAAKQVDAVFLPHPSPTSVEKAG